MGINPLFLVAKRDFIWGLIPKLFFLLRGFSPSTLILIVKKMIEQGCPQGSILMIQKRDLGIIKLEQLIALGIGPSLETGVRG